MWLVTRVWEWKSFLSLDFSRLIFYRTSSDTGRRGLGRIRIYALFYSTTFTQDEIRPIESSTIIQRERGRVIRTELITKWRGGGIHCIAWKNFLCRRLVCEPGARRIQPVTTLSLGRRIACLIDSPDANLEIRGDVVSSGSGARDLSRPFARYPLWK